MPALYRSTRDPRELAQNQRDTVQQRGDQLNQEFQNQGDQANQNATNYAGFLDPIEQQMASGNGGYTADEAAAIQGNQGPYALNSLPTSQEGLQGNFLTGDEQSGMMGNTSSYGDYFDPSHFRDSLAGDQGNQDAAVGNLRRDLGNSINPNNLKQSQGYADAMHEQVNRNGANVRGAVGGTATGTRGALSGEQGAAHGAIGGMATGTRGALTGEQGAVRGAIDPAALRQAADAAKNEVMTPEEEERMVTAAGISAGSRNQAAIGSLERQARAAGTNPLGVAAYRARRDNETAAQAGDEMTKARVAARGERATEALGSENQRIGAEQQLAGLKTGTEMQMGQQGVANEQFLGGQNLGAELQMGQQGVANEQFLGGQNLGAEQQLGKQSLDQSNLQEQNRQAAEQYLTGAGMQAATTGGEAEMQNAQQKTVQEQQQNQYLANTGTSLRMAQDQANANRAAAVAGNRQQTNEGNQATQYSQGMGVNQAGSQRATQVGNTRLSQQNTGLGLQQNQNQQQNQNAQAGYQRQLGAYGTQTGGTGQAVNSQLNAQGIPTTTDKIVGGVTGALGAAAAFLEDGGVATEPTLAVVGEHGPEAVVPIGQGYRSRMSRPAMPRAARKPMRYGHREVA